MALTDKTYSILQAINDHDNTMSEQQLSRYLTSIYSTDYLLAQKMIYVEINEDGAPNGVYHVDDEGYKYMVNHQKDVRLFWMNFLSHFVTGLITGSLGTLVLEHIILKLL